jgi:hypothetical protein
MRVTRRYHTTSSNVALVFILSLSLSLSLFSLSLSLSLALSLSTQHTTGEKVLVEQEAAAVVNRALQALKQSRDECAAVSFNVVVV